jgi:hypothetical protein
MKTEEIERLNSLSEKAMKDIATPEELTELNHLLIIWNESTEYNLIQGLYNPNLKSL